VCLYFVHACLKWNIIECLCVNPMFCVRNIPTLRFATITYQLPRLPTRVLALRVFLFSTFRLQSVHHFFFCLFFFISFNNVFVICCVPPLDIISDIFVRRLLSPTGTPTHVLRATIAREVPRRPRRTRVQRVATVVSRADPP
jgi:hypothetical protein